MKTVIVFALLFFSAAFAFAQTPSSSPPSQPPPSSTPPPQQPPVVQHPMRSRILDPRRMQPFPMNPVSESDMLRARVMVLQRVVSPLYRKPTDKELAGLTVSDEILKRYSTFLSSEDSGVFRLVPDTGCEHNERVISAREDCIKYSIPGSGNSYSFRSGSHRLRHLADVTFTNGKLSITGIFMHGIVTDLGDVSVENTNLMTAGIKPLLDFRPSTSADDVLQVDRVIENGLTNGVFRYSKEVVPKAGHTYAIRSVAYRGKVVRAAGGVRYNELDYDKRRDVVTVFRVVESHPEAGLTIVWRKLLDTEPPRIRMPKLERKDDKGDLEGEAN